MQGPAHMGSLTLGRTLPAIKILNSSFSALSIHVLDLLVSPPVLFRKPSYISKNHFIYFGKCQVSSVFIYESILNRGPSYLFIVAAVIGTVIRGHR